MAASKTPAEPETAEQAQDETPPPKQDAKTLVGEYLDETPRTYLWPDGPQTVERGDVVALPDGWGNDGRFRVAKLIITRLRDNHPDQAAKTSAAQSQARADVHARVAEEA